MGRARWAGPGLLAPRPLLAAPGAQGARSARLPGTSQCPEPCFGAEVRGAVEGREGPCACGVHSRVAHFLSRVGLNVDSALTATGSRNATQAQESGRCGHGPVKAPFRSRWWAERSGLPQSSGGGLAPLQRVQGMSRLTQLGPLLVNVLGAWHFRPGSALRGLPKDSLPGACVLGWPVVPLL